MQLKHLLVGSLMTLCMMTSCKGDSKITVKYEGPNEISYKNGVPITMEWSLSRKLNSNEKIEYIGIKEIKVDGSVKHTDGEIKVEDKKVTNSFTLTKCNAQTILSANLSLTVYNKDGGSVSNTAETGTITFTFAG